MASSPIPPMLIELQLETAKIQAQMQQLNGKFEDFGRTVEKQGSFLTKFKATAAGVFTGGLMVQGLNSIKQAFSEAVADADLYEKTIAKMNAVIASTGNVAGLSAEGLKAQASALENLSAVDENVILNGQNIIATFTQIRNVAGEGNDIFNQTTKAALDLSVALGQDMQSSAIQLGKALNDPIKGVSALQRVGVAFDAQQKQMIKTMVESGDILGAQKVILAEVNREFGGAAKAAGDTFGGAVTRAKDKVQDFMRDGILKLEPILLSIGKIIGSVIMPVLEKLGKFFTENANAIKAYVTILAMATAGFYAYRAAMVATKVAQEAYVIITAIMKGATLASIASTNGLAASMLLLNTAIRANPIGLIVTALMLVGAAFVYAWKHSETFRGVVIKGMQLVLNALSFVVGAFGKLTGFLSKVPGMGWAKGIADGAKSAADAISRTSKNLTDLKSDFKGMGNVSMTTGSAGVTGKSGNADKPTGVTADQIKAAKAAAKERADSIAKANKEVVKIYDDMNKAIADGNEKAAEALKKRDEAVADTTAKYAKKELAIKAKKDEELAANKKKWDDAYKKATDASEAEITKIKESYEKKRADIEASYTERKANLQADAQKKIADATAKAIDDQAKIVQQSIDRLRSAFATGTAASITEIFKAGATSADKMLEQLKSKLQAAKELQKNAAALAAAGYSQTFIEDVVKNGPEIGNQMAAALLDASDETKKQLQTLYSQVNDISNHGVDALAKTMNQGGKLATQELMDAYNQVPKDLAITLADINDQLTTDLASAQKEYANSMAEAASTRDAAIADSKAKLTEALTAADEALAEANTATMKEFNDAMAENAANLAEALANIQKDYEDTIAQIAENTKAKLAELQASLAAVAATLAELGAKQASINAINNAPVYIPPAVVPPTTTPSASGNNNTVNNNTNIAQTFVTPQADPADVHLATLSAMKYGNAITVNTTTLEGVMRASGLKTPTATIAKPIMNVGAYDR